MPKSLGRALPLPSFGQNPKEQQLFFRNVFPQSEVKKSKLQTTSTTITIRERGGYQVVGWILATVNLKSHCFLSFSAEYSVNQLLHILQRNNKDCWLDDRLVCQDFELDFDINTEWFVSAFHGPRYGMTSRWSWITPFYSPAPIPTPSSIPKSHLAPGLEETTWQ